jgi:hypothetical protein
MSHQVEGLQKAGDFGFRAERFRRRIWILDFEFECSFWNCEGMKNFVLERNLTG